VEFGDTRFGFVGGLLFTAFALFWVAAFIWYIFDLIKRLIIKKSRESAVDEIKSSLKESGKSAKFIARDKDFHKELRREFRPQIILLSIIAITLLLTLLFERLGIDV